MAKSFYIIDGHAQIFRAFYAPFRELSSPSGEPTKATYVFTQMLLNLIGQRKPEYLAMVIDSGDEYVFRKEIYFYATASLCGAVVFVVLQRWLVEVSASVLIGASVTLALRLAAIRWKLALPLFNPRHPPRAD